MATIAKALKQKNKLKLEISQLQKRLNTYNSVIKGNQRPFDLTQTEDALFECIQKLTLLKTYITRANQPVQERIYRLSELKGLIAFYKKLPVNEGRIAEKYGNESNEYEVLFNEAARDKRISKLEAEADELQDGLESFNHYTEI